MSHYIPVFFFPVEKNELPQSLENWHSVDHMLGERWEKRTESRLRTSTSRNWWHQRALCLICKSLAINGLEFVQSEIVCLDKERLQSAAHALDKVLGQIRDGIPDLGPEIEAEGSIWWLRRYIEGDTTKEFPSDTLRKAFDESQPVSEISIGQDIGYGSLVDFYSFIKSLHMAVTECLSEGKCLLYVQPQP